MKNLLPFAFILVSFSAYCQVNPIIKSAGTIYEIPKATVTSDPDMTYKIVVDISRGGKESALNWGLNNAARMINLHAVAGVKPENLEVVLVIHGGTTKTLLKPSPFKAKFKNDNPNIELIEELLSKDVQIMVCGQSLRSRGYEENDLIEGVEVSVSALTAISMFEIKGYAHFIFQ